jgi:hypothetical protein
MDLEKQAGKTNVRCADLKYAQAKCLNLALEGEIEDKETVYVSDKVCSYTAPTSSANASVFFNTTDITDVPNHPQFAKLA